MRRQLLLQARLGAERPDDQLNRAGGQPPATARQPQRRLLGWGGGAAARGELLQQPRAITEPGGQDGAGLGVQGDLAGRTRT